MREDEAEELLQPSLRALARLHQAYQDYDRRGPEACVAALDSVIARLSARNVREFVTRELPSSLRFSPLTREREEKFREIETRLSRLFGYEERDTKKYLNQALKQLASGIAGGRPAFTSLSDLKSFLQRTQEEALSSMHEKLGWNIKKRRENRAALERCDTAVYSVGIVLADLLNPSAVSFSCAVGSVTAARVTQT
jgi:hypothetical protein